MALGWISIAGAEVFLGGDLNGDGRFDIADKVIMDRALVGLPPGVSQTCAAVPPLETADQSGVAPCPNQDILTDPNQLAELKNAIQNGTFVYLDVPFDGGDPDILLKKCGFEGFWNPADNIDPVAPMDVFIPLPVTIQSLFQTGNAGICTTNFVNFGLDEGFPRAGVYRKEVKVSHAGSTWHTRLRFTISGTAAGNSFASEGISTFGGDDIANLIYEVNGKVVPHADVLTEVYALHAPSPGAHIDVRKTALGPIVWTADVEFICATKS